jgi:hypothetical protein
MGQWIDFWLLSLPDAIITKGYAAILVLGEIGLVIGIIVRKWGTRSGLVKTV